MPIVSTEILSQGRFSDGIHLSVKLTDQNGKERIVNRKFTHGTDINAVVTAITAKQDKSLVNDELRRAVYLEPWDYQLQHATLVQLRDYVREQYQVVKFKQERLKVARRIIEWVENGRFTVAQIRSAFGKTPAEFTAFRNRLIDLRDADDLLENVRGE